MYNDLNLTNNKSIYDAVFVSQGLPCFPVSNRMIIYKKYGDNVWV